MIGFSWLLMTALIASTISGCASTEPARSTAGVTSAMTANVAGTWTGFTGQGAYAGTMVYELQQDGTKVSGTASASEIAGAAGGSIYLQGTVEGDIFSYSLTRGTCCGRLTIKGDEMSGHTTSGYPVQVRRQK